jgi:hypothetical protein
MAYQRAVLKGTLGGTVQVRNMFTANVVEAGGDDAETLWTAYLTSVIDPICDMCVSLLQYTNYDIQERVGTQWETIQEVDFPFTGATTGDQLPNAVALVLLGKATGIKHVGRKFFSGISEPSSTINALATGAVATAALALLGYITPFTGIGGGLIEPGVIDQGGAFHPFVGGVVSSLLGSMRRRKPGIGI